MIRINFQPYTRQQLETIVRARLTSAKEGLDEGNRDVIEEKAITMASMKVSGISGDARRVLDICR
jgi:origin recognition complex subunit 1